MIVSRTLQPVVASVGLILVGLVGCSNDPPAGADAAGADAATDAGASDGSAPDVGVAPSDARVSDARDAAPSDAGGPTCLSVDADPTGTDAIEDGNGRATVIVTDRESCQRTYTITTTASLRDGRPDNPRVVTEQGGWPTTRTGNDLFDALHALALEEVRENSVDRIRDFAFDDGRPVPCGDGGCFETGRLWNYVWTRDTAYAVELALAPLDPARARNSLEFKLSERREGGDLQIVQDTGSGGSYPVSSDRVSWALGARALLAVLDGPAREAFAARALEALTNTLEHDRTIVFDPDDGLYRGEQSFLDWREQSYPEWTAQDTVHIAMSKALSTNLLHYHAMRLAADLASERDDATARARYDGWADALREAIRARFWLEDAGMFSTFITTTLDPAPTHRFDLLGSALAVLFDVADETQADRILANYPHYGPGAPVHWPQQQQTPIYHNRGEWPFVTAYWLRAAAHADNDAVATRMVHALLRGAALNLSNMENFEAASGAPWVNEDTSSGPVVNSQRQLWSVAGYLAMVHRVIFGLEARPEGLVVRPYLTATLRRQLFAGTETLVLTDFPYRGRLVDVVLHLPAATASGGSYSVARVEFNGAPLDGPVLRAEQLETTNRVDVHLESPGASATLTERNAADWRDIFQPRTPRIAALSEVGGRLRLDLDRNGETAPVVFHVLRDGVRVAEGLADGTTSWLDPSVNPDADASPCYSLESCFVSSGNCSQHSPPVCWWGRGLVHVQRFGAAALTNAGGTPSTNHGRFHYEAWGDDGHRLQLRGLTPTQSGRHLLQVVYGNGAGAVSTGVTCALKRLVVRDEATGAVVGEGALVMPHLGDWDRWEDSNFVAVDLEVGRTYRVVIESHDDYVNMSSFAHFANYTGGLGGRAGAFNRVNIAELAVLYRP